MDLLGNYTCACPPGYTGRNCEINIDECSINPNICPANSTCDDVPGTYTCTCNPGYTAKGKDVCEEINECDTMPCFNGGTCRDAVGNYTCDCLDGYTGPNCETDLRMSSEANFAVYIGAGSGAFLFLLIVIVVVVIVRAKRKSKKTVPITEKDTDESNKSVEMMQIKNMEDTQVNQLAETDNSGDEAFELFGSNEKIDETKNVNEPKIGVGDRVCVNKKNKGYVKFVGPMESVFNDVDFIGVELDEPLGSGDGSFGGKSYFKCKPLHSVFTTQDFVSVLQKKENNNEGADVDVDFPERKHTNWSEYFRQGSQKTIETKATDTTIDIMKKLKANSQYQNV